MKNYGFKMEIPSFYVVDSKLYPLDQKYVFQLTRYVLPEEESYTVQTHLLNGKSHKQTFKELWSKYDGHTVLELLYREDAFLEQSDQFIFDNIRHVIQQFSEDGQYLALLMADHCPGEFPDT